ncbi:MAG: nucleotidyltransferase family protein [Gemmatimonadaceae bacterium]
MRRSGARGESPLVARLPAESAFVALMASRRDVDDEMLSRHAAERPMQWDSLVTLAARERAIAPLAHALHALPSSAVPQDVQRRVDRFAMIADFQLSTLHDRLGRVLGLLSSRGIEALLLKGAGLAYSAYDRPTDRPMGDIDLLVRPDRAAEAWELALTDGWMRRRDIAPERSYEAHQHLPPLEDSDGLQMGLELHTALFTHQAPFQLPASQIWARARLVQVGAHTAYVPSVEDQLLHAALHFAWSHEMTFGSWRTLSDVERLTADGDVRWDAFVRAANEAHGGTCCYWTLRLARELVGARVPAEVLEQLTPPLPARVSRSLMTYFASQALPVLNTTTRSVSLSRALWTLGIRPRAQGHGASRPWLDTEDWVRDEHGMKNAKGSPVQRFFRKGVGLLRMVIHLIGF